MAASFEFRRPLRFEDEFDVLAPHRRRSRTKSIRYACALTRGDERIATGAMTIVCVSRTRERADAAVPIPPTWPRAFRGGRRCDVEPDVMADRAMLTPDECLERGELVAAAGRAAARLLPAIYGRNRSTRASSMRPAFGSLTPAVAGRPSARCRSRPRRELVADQDAHPPWGTALTEPIERYTRYCQTSSTTGRPLRWIDTNESWQWMLDCWKAVYRAARVGAGDRVFFPFSFGPFLGFWSAFEAGCQIGAHACPAAACRASCGWR